MYLKDLDRKGIDRRFILTPSEFFNNFFGSYNELCDERFTPQELFYLLEGCLYNCSNKQVNLENVLTGKIILVRYDKGMIKAYYRPVIHVNNKKYIKQCLEEINDIAGNIFLEEYANDQVQQKVLTKY